MSDQLTQRVLSVIAATQRIGPETVTIDKSFQELGIDSMDGINILFALENEFGESHEHPVTARSEVREPRRQGRARHPGHAWFRTRDRRSV